MSNLIFLSVSIGCLLFFILTVYFIFKTRQLRLIFNYELEQLEHQYQVTNSELLHLKHDHEQQQLENTELKIELSNVKLLLDEHKKQAATQQALLVSSEQRLTQQFENLASRIFSSNSRQLNEINQQSLTLLLTPLRDQLTTFKKEVQDGLSLEAKERFSLKKEISSLQSLNQTLAAEATNLTQALKGNNKLQGTWGEAILNQILENAGLRNGYEFEVQKNFTNSENQRFLPDVIVHLPQGGDIVVDSKVSLISYERFFNSELPEQKQHELTAHVQALRQHIKQLGGKEYQKLNNIKSLDYVLMFIPIESALQIALDVEPQLINDAMKNNIMLVSPNSLLIALRTISNLWKYEYQNQHSADIAKKAGLLYDKIRGFIDELEVLGTNLERVDSSYQLLVNRLVNGRQNVISQIEQFRDMGIEVKKSINTDYWENKKETLEANHFVEIEATENVEAKE